MNRLRVSKSTRFWAAAIFVILVTGMTSMSKEQSTPIRLEAARRGGNVEIKLIGQPGPRHRYIYILDIVGTSRSRHTASFTGGSLPKEINRSRFPDQPPWRIEFRISDSEGHIIHEQTVSDRDAALIGR